MADGGGVCEADTEYYEKNSIHVVLAHHGYIRRRV